MLPVLIRSHRALPEKLTAEVRRIVEAGFIADLLDGHHGVFQQTAGMSDPSNPDRIADGPVPRFRIDPAEVVGMALQGFRDLRCGNILLEMEQDEAVGLLDQTARSAEKLRRPRLSLRLADQQRCQVVAG